MQKQTRMDWMALAVMGIALSFLGCSASSTMDRPPQTSPSALKARFQSELDTLRERYQFPGATAAYCLPDGTVEVVATGMADVELSIPMTPRSRMLAASVGKTFVGATMLALEQEGRLNLDDPVKRWLGDEPWFARLANHDTITLRQLLTHSAGIRDHVSTEGFVKAISSNGNVAALALPPQALLSFILDEPPLFKPGEGWHYSDTGYILIGLVIEKATGRRYYEEITERFLAPLHLGLTSPSDRLELPGLAAGYMAPDNPFGFPPKTTVQPGIMAWNPAIEWTGGGLVSNPKDLVLWAQALFGGRAMPGDYLGALLRSTPVDEESDSAYGLGVGIHVNGPLGPTHGHSGWIPGYCSSLRYYSRHGVTIAFQINTDIGIVDGSTSLMEEAETQLARIVIAAVAGGSVSD